MSYLKIIVIIVLLFSVSFPLSGNSYDFNNKTFKVGIYDSSLTYPYSSDTIENFILHIANSYNWVPKFYYFSRDQLLKSLNTGDLDIVMDFCSDDLYDTQPLFSLWGVLYKLNSDKKEIYNVFDLEDAGISVNNYTYFEFLKFKSKKLNLKLHLVLTTSALKSLNLLEGKKVGYALIINSDTFSDKHFSNIKVTNFQFSPAEIAFKFSKHLNHSLVERLKSEVVSFKASKTSFLKPYLPYNVKKAIPLWVYYLITIILVVFILLIYTIYFLRKNLRRKIIEIDKVNKEIVKESNNIDVATKQMKALNENLEKSYQNLEMKSNLLNRLYDIVQLLSKKDLDLEEVSEKILKFAISSVYPANLGSISINRYGRWFFLATIGHDKDRLNSLNLSSKYFIMPKKPILIKNIQNTDIKIMPKDIYEKFAKCLVPIKETILVPIHISGEVTGNIALDIAASSDKYFTERSLNQLNDIAFVVSSFLTVKNYNDSKIEFEKDILISVIKLLELFYPTMEGHSQFVAQYSSELAKTMGLSESVIEDIYLAGLLHDIGVIGVPKEILNKPGPLTKEEYDLVKEHPVLAYTILRESKLIGKIAKIVRHHHERYDGKGYPDGLRGEEIPLESKIIAIVDVWDTMLTDRVYAKALTFEEAVKELRENSGTQFDPKVVEYFLKILKVED